MDEDNFLNGPSEDLFESSYDNWFEDFTCASRASTNSDSKSTFESKPSGDCLDSGTSITSDASPAAEKIGNVPEIWMSILSQADQATLRSAIRVNKAWYTEGVPHLWYSPNEAGLRFQGIPRRQPERLAFYAGLVRHIQYSIWTDRGNQGRTYMKSKKKQVMPEFPNLASLECLTSSLSEGTAAQLRTIFVPSLREVVIADYVAYDRYMGRLDELGGVSWFDIMCMECPLLETLSLGEGSGISREDFHHFLCRAINLHTVKLDRGNEHLLIDLVRPVLKSLKTSPEWMMRQDSYKNLSQLYALEYLDIAVADATVVNDQLFHLQHLRQLAHLHIWPTNNIGTTRCTVTAGELISLIEALPELVDLRIWLEFDFFRYEETVEAAHDLPGRYPQFDNLENRRSYLEYLQKIAEVEHKAMCERIEQSWTHGDDGNA